MYHRHHLNYNTPDAKHGDKTHYDILCRDQNDNKSKSHTDTYSLKRIIYQVSYEIKPSPSATSNQETLIDSSWADFFNFCYDIFQSI